MKKHSLLAAIILLAFFSGCFGKSRTAPTEMPQSTNLQGLTKNSSSRLELVKSEADALEEYRRDRERQNQVEFAGRS